ncbi:MAG: hypothetical protein V4591_06875 [Bdellovibrionota bacterium]
MNDKVISLSEKRQQKKQELKKIEPPSGEVVKLWRLSLAIDDLVKAAILEDKLAGDEVATIFANRLGTLIACCENQAELSKFCMEIIDRMNSQDVADKGA